LGRAIVGDKGARWEKTGSFLASQKSQKKIPKGLKETKGKKAKEKKKKTETGPDEGWSREVMTEHPEKEKKKSGGSKNPRRSEGLHRNSKIPREGWASSEGSELKCVHKKKNQRTGSQGTARQGKRTGALQKRKNFGTECPASRYTS